MKINKTIHITQRFQQDKPQPRRPGRLQRLRKDLTGPPVYVLKQTGIGLSRDGIVHAD